jgi:hypothetical protein
MPYFIHLFCPASSVGASSTVLHKKYILDIHFKIHKRTGPTPANR